MRSAPHAASGGAVTFGLGARAARGKTSVGLLRGGPDVHALAGWEGGPIALRAGARLRRRPVVVGLLDPRGASDPVDDEGASEAARWVTSRGGVVKGVVRGDDLAALLAERFVSRLAVDPAGPCVFVAAVGSFGVVAAARDGKVNFAHVFRAEAPSAFATELEKALRHAGRTGRIGGARTVVVAPTGGPRERIPAVLGRVGLAPPSFPFPDARPEEVLAGCLAEEVAVRRPSRFHPAAVAAAGLVLVATFGAHRYVGAEVRRLEAARARAAEARAAVLRRAVEVEEAVLSRRPTEAAVTAYPERTRSWIDLLVFLGRSIPPGVALDGIEALAAPPPASDAVPYAGIRGGEERSGGAEGGRPDYVLSGRARSLDEVDRFVRVLDETPWVVRTIDHVRDAEEEEDGGYRFAIGVSRVEGGTGTGGAA